MQHPATVTHRRGPQPHYPAIMPAHADNSVKQCIAHPNLAWLREGLSQDRVVLTADQVGLSIDHGMAALLHRRAAVTDAHSARVLAQAARQLSMRELAHQQALTTLAKACADADIDVLLIKGEAVARTLPYPPATRTRSDIDVWVRAGQLEKFRALLIAVGYPTTHAITQRWARFELIHGGGHAVLVGFDVHIHPFFRPRMLPQRDFDTVWADAVALPGLDGLRAPSPFDAFLIAALHLAKNPFKRWIWLYDIDQLCRHYPDAVALACAQAAPWQIAGLLADALQRSVEVFDTPLPCALPIATAGEPFASMLSSPNRWIALRRDLAALPDHRARLGFLLELLTRPR